MAVDFSQVWECTNEEYHGSLAEDSHSSLDLFKESIEQYAAKRVFRTVAAEPPTEAMEFGTLFHTAILEPENLEMEYIPYEKHDRRTKAGKLGWEKFLERAQGRRFVKPEDLAMVKRMRDGCLRNPQAATFIEGPGFSERAFRWHDADTGLPLKMRIDKLFASGGIADLKTTVHCDPESFARTAYNFGYHRQAAMYLDGGKQFGIGGPFVFLACSKTPPHECVCYELDFNTLNLGLSENKGILYELAARRKANAWHGRYSGAVNKLSVPRYAFKP